MTDITLPPKDTRTQERHAQKSSQFYDLTVAENNARLDNKTMPNDARDEIKFIQAELLARFGNEV